MYLKLNVKLKYNMEVILDQTFIQGFVTAPVRCIILEFVLDKIKLFLS